jgi:hypothetical protein
MTDERYSTRKVATGLTGACHAACRGGQKNESWPSHNARVILIGHGVQINRGKAYGWRKLSKIDPGEGSPPPTFDDVQIGKRGPRG